MRIILAIMLCQTSARAISLNELLAQANLWQPQTCVPSPDWRLTTRSLSQDNIGYAIIDTHDNTRVAKINYEAQNGTPAIIYLNVQPEYQHKGIASMLVGYALTDYRNRGFDTAYVKAEPIHERAGSPHYQKTLGNLVKFYEHTGGTVAIRRTNTVQMVFDLTLSQSN